MVFSQCLKDALIENTLLLRSKHTIQIMITSSWYKASLDKI